MQLQNDSSILECAYKKNDIFRVHLSRVDDFKSLWNFEIAFKTKWFHTTSLLLMLFIDREIS